ncbi:MAG: undecaprenyl-phosphate glucose phosphotransferase [Saprospiraceae bacterium]|nr:undecaprenyl-phosphate glucose phosphotransferase [Saprospiraceae bacterium]
MQKRQQIFFSLISILGDVLIINLMLYYFCFHVTIKCYGHLWYLMFVFASLAWIILALSFKTYSLSRNKERKKKVEQILKACFVLFFLFIVGSSFGRFEIVLTLKLFVPVIVASFLIIFWNLILDSLMHYFQKLGFNQKNLLIIGYNNQTLELSNYFNENLWGGYKFKGFIHNIDKSIENTAGNFDEIEKVVKEENINAFFIYLNSVPDSYLNKIKDIAYSNHVEINIVPDLKDFISFKHYYQRFDIFPIISISQSPLSSLFNRAIKRLTDIIISIIVLILIFSWIAPIILLMIRITSKGQAFFKQRRTGYNNKEFTCLKFRTMIENEDADLIQAVKNDKRLTKIGKFLRLTNLDELPQFINVLLGEMSVVGPRPHMLFHTEKYSKEISNYMHRHYIKPGITGLAQVRGFRGSTPDISIMKKRIEFDLFYIENWSFWLDIKIMFLTVVNIFRGEKGG